MVSTSVPGMHSWGNQGYASLPGAHGLSPCYGGSLRASFLLGLGVAGMADHMRPQGYISSVFLRPIQHNFPIKSRFLMRPQLLTRY